ncbi:hypothetical protein RchiOBHm_Chr1g0365411 [Rosa chinensis]|uniref:DUF4378 domain-containing protein n=1 Tax=Rosa chinensis TaxID=74649 RepID=A0A2P6SJZ6_ROSCH|nr:uncharacterized protein LOC112182741 isoform X1 [Rosa chinensis]XP_024177048.1 uncharacterized protein LOC112182741 isoform X1 [Rosa chinensis]XP_040367334.1 uncharacterized protein LOC112182741 isoform X1 [Rosa chinensis]PRQ59005.1 hypothetical protein RchiOBHm_Chr1g0365411 [Rosa chinensis]
MESTRVSPSVIAKLMGLAESPQQQPVQKRRRVLSENYFHRVASIGVREKCHSLRSVVGHQDCKDVFEVVSPLKGDNDFNLSVHKGTENSGLSELKMETRQEEFQVSSEKYECLPGEVGLDGLHKFLRSPLKSNRKGCSPSTGVVALKPKHGLADSSARSFPPMSSLEAYQLVDEKCTEFPSPSNGKIHGKGIEPIGKVSRPRSRGGNSIAMASELLRSPSLNLSDRRNQYQSFSYSDESYVAREAKGQLSEQWKKTEKFEGCGRADRGITLGDSLAMPVHEIGPRNLNYKLGMHFRPRKKPVKHDLKDLDLSKFRKHQDKYEALCNEWPFTPKRSVNWAQSRSCEYKFNHKDRSRPINLRTNNKKFQSFPSLESEGSFTVENTCMVHNDLKNGTEEKDSKTTDTSVQKETSMEVDEESNFPLHCFTTSDCMASLEDVYQPSPVSVLEPPFRGDNSPSPERLGSVNVDTSEYSDTCSEGSGMIVSSDDDTSERSVKDYKESSLVGLFNVEESRDFSYLIDVLLEAGFYCRGVEMDCDTWCFQECPMSHYVFESLEKKFGDQLSWNRSDRRLLFDRINDWLIEILQPSMGEPIWTKPVSRRIRTQSGQEMIEENLWMLLVNQEKEGMEARKNLEEKLLRSGIGNLDLGDEIDFIGREVERLLIDELVEELVSNLAQRV